MWPDPMPAKASGMRFVHEIEITQFAKEPNLGSGLELCRVLLIKIDGECDFETTGAIRVRLNDLVRCKWNGFRKVWIFWQFFPYKIAERNVFQVCECAAVVSDNDFIDDGISTPPPLIDYTAASNAIFNWFVDAYNAARPRLEYGQLNTYGSPSAKIGCIGSFDGGGRSFFGFFYGSPRINKGAPNQDDANKSQEGLGAGRPGHPLSPFGHALLGGKIAAGLLPFFGGLWFVYRSYERAGEALQLALDGFKRQLIVAGLWLVLGFSSAGLTSGVTTYWLGVCGAA